MSQRGTRWLAALVTLYGTNWITLLGGILSGVSLVLIAGFLIIGLLDLSDSPYLGIMAFLIMPGLLVFGLLMVPVGATWERLRRKRLGLAPAEAAQGRFPIIDFNAPNTRRVGAIVIVVTVCALLAISTASYKGVEYMDSPKFCGLVCHTVMEPEYTSYTNSPHAQVRCVECHIGPGASWFVRSKLSGLGQVWAVFTNSYECPIPAPVANLRPSRDTCEQCHWPAKFTGDRVKIISKFQEDEKNTPTKTVMILHIGGGANESSGIHGHHMRSGVKMYYVSTDDARQNIVQVRYEQPDGTSVTYKAADQGDKSKWREERLMDCIDCHNRPTHIMQAPDAAMDAALADGRIDPSIPYIKKEGVAALKGIKLAESDLDEISQKIAKYYAEEQADFYKEHRDLVDAAIAQVRAIYQRNVFPKMKVGWETYINNLGHSDSMKGCMRCHDGNLTSDDGKTIEQDCAVCHNVLAWDEENPEILKQLQGGA